jgi:tetratricopeptide (TPR) repeat protein
MTHLVCFFLVLVTSACAEVDNSPVGLARTLRIRVAVADGQACDASVRIGQLGLVGTTVAQGLNKDECVVDFNNVPAGNYHLEVSVHGVDVPGMETVEVEGRSMQEIRVSVPRAPAAESKAGSNSMISIAQLNIPAAARKEFDAGTASMTKENWKKAADYLNKAVSIYPQYAEAYNNLAVTDAHLGDRNAERIALQKAIAVNDRFAPAYVNLARMDIVDRNYVDAESRLNLAGAIDPNDGMTLVLLSSMQFVNRHYDLAIATARKAHMNSQNPHALAHHVAAQALRAEGKDREALYELQIFLQEESTGPRADAVRKEMATLLAQAH